MSETVRQRQPRSSSSTGRNNTQNSIGIGTTNILDKGTKLRLLEEQMDRRTKQKIANSLQSNSNKLLAKMYLVVLVVLVLVLAIAILVIYKDQILAGGNSVSSNKTTSTTTKSTATKPTTIPKNIKQPPILLMTMFPPHLSPKRDFQRFQGSWVYATPENKPTREAVTKTIQLREALKYKQNNQQNYPKVLLRSFEQDELHSYMSADRAQQYCGSDFIEFVPRSSPLSSLSVDEAKGKTPPNEESEKKKNAKLNSNSNAFASSSTTSMEEVLRRDLYVWCLIVSDVVDGYVGIDLELNKSFGDEVWKQVIARTQTSDNKEQEPSSSLPSKSVAIQLSDQRLSTFFIYFSKTNDGDSPAVSSYDTTVPGQMLQWLKDEALRYYDNDVDVERGLNNKNESSWWLVKEYRERYEQQLNDLVMKDIKSKDESNNRDWLLIPTTCSLQTIKDNEENGFKEGKSVIENTQRRIGRHCHATTIERGGRQQEECCDIFMPVDVDDDGNNSIVQEPAVSEKDNLRKDLLRH